MNLPEVGTIVRLMDQHYMGNPLAVVVPLDFDPHGPYGSHDAGVCTKLLEYHGGRGTHIWYIDVKYYLFEIVPEDEIPDHISALAMRCLLDPNFVPEISD